jgi:hypothetical protein
MFRTKATEILSALSSNEIKELKSFVNSPIHNKNKNIIKLYEALKPFYPEFADKKCNKEMLYKKIFGNKPYNDKIMRNLLSEMYKLLEDYLVFKSSKLPTFKNMLLFEQLINFDNVFLKKYNEANEAIKKEKQDNDYFKKKGTLLQSRIKFFLDRNKQHKITMEALHRGENHIFELLCLLPENISNINANETSYNLDYGFKASEIFFECFDYTRFINLLEGKHHDFEFLKLNYHKFMLFFANHPEDIYHSREIKNYISEHYEKFGDDYLIEVFGQLTNFYTKKTDSGYEEEILQDRFEIYQLQLKTNVLFTRWLTLLTYRSIILTALALNEIEWTENFINSSIGRVHPSEKEFSLNYGKALVAYKKKQYTEVTALCSTLKQDNPWYKFFVKWLIFQTYYELGYSEQFFFHSDAFRKYIDYTNNIIASRKEDYRKVIRFGNRLMNLKVKDITDKESIYLLKQEIEEHTMGDPSGKRWLLEKINELENKH